MNTLSMPVVSALFSVYFFWGTTYLAMKFAIETLPPYIMLASRFGLAGAIMYMILRLNKAEAPTKKQWRSAAITGGILLFLSTGSVTLAETVVPSNIAAAVVAGVPLWMVFFQWTIFKQGTPGIWTSLGLILGFIGVAVLVNSSGSKEGASALWGYLLLVFSSAMWALGSLISRVLDTPKSQFMAISTQMLFGAFFCFIAGVLKGEASDINIANFSARSMLAVLYLIVFGSIVGYGSYIWLLRNTSPTLVSTYAYVNPVVAILMGWALAGETLNMQEIIAVFIILTAVIAIIKENSKIKKSGS
ncbi:MAG: EamA family transporter [Synergistaceae bacterium]|nr:EamA family transporter [Synergistaceae bacterium]